MDHQVLGLSLRRLGAVGSVCPVAPTRSDGAKPWHAAQLTIIIKPELSQMTHARKALVLDRDGTLIAHIPYLHDPQQVTLLPGVREGLRRAQAAGCLLFLHSNQSGVGRGYFTPEAVDQCNDRMLELLDLGAALFARICIAPEAPDQPSLYRKPSPRFAQELMSAYDLAPKDIWYVGDRGSDLATAAAAGTNGVGVATGLNDLANELKEQGLVGFPIFSVFDVAIRHILAEA